MVNANITLSDWVHEHFPHGAINHIHHEGVYRYYCSCGSAIEDCEQDNEDDINTDDDDHPLATADIDHLGHRP